VNVSVMCGSENKQCLFPYTALTSWFCNRDLTLCSSVVTICTTTLTFKSVFMCFVWISEQTAITSLYSINYLFFITEMECLLCGTSWMFQCNSD